MKSKADLSGELVPTGWTAQFADAVAAALREFAPTLAGSKVTLLSVVCLPWHGLLSLAILTAEELANDTALGDPRRTMDWKHGEFTEEVQAWAATIPLAREMQSVYEEAEDCPTAAVSFLQACARAIGTATVSDAMDRLPKAEGFRISVPHPDNGSEFFS